MIFLRWAAYRHSPSCWVSQQQAMLCSFAPYAHNSHIKFHLQARLGGDTPSSVLLALTDTVPLHTHNNSQHITSGASHAWTYQPCSLWMLHAHPGYFLLQRQTSVNTQSFIYTLVLVYQSMLVPASCETPSSVQCLAVTGALRLSMRRALTMCGFSSTAAHRVAPR